MIASVDGVIAAVKPDSVVIEVGGVGLRVFAPTSTLASLGGVGQRARLQTHVYMKEDVLALYGFATPEELRLFVLLMDVSGVGPRNAVKMLSVMRPQDLVAAIVREDAASLTRIPGVGKKLAARISLELKGPLEKEWAVEPSGAAPAVVVDDEALVALMGLGYTAAEARTALAAVEDVDELPLEQKITQALQLIGGR